MACALKKGLRAQLRGGVIAFAKFIAILFPFYFFVSFAVLPANSQMLDALEAWKNRDKSQPSQPAKKPQKATPPVAKSKPKQERVTLPDDVPVPVISPRSLQRPPSDLMREAGVIIPDGQWSSVGDPNLSYLNMISEDERRVHLMLIRKMREEELIKYDPNFGVSPERFARMFNDTKRIYELGKRKAPTLSYSDKKNLDTLNTYFQAGTWGLAGTVITTGGVIAGTVVSAPVVVTTAIVVSLAGGTVIEHLKQSGEETSDQDKLSEAGRKAAVSTAISALSLGMPDTGDESGAAAEGMTETFNNLVNFPDEYNSMEEEYRKALQNRRPYVLLDSAGKVTAHSYNQFGNSGFQVILVPEQTPR
jgi:hypothetical protein